MDGVVLNATRAGYACVNGLQLYYEIHGSGRPLVLLHGAFGSVDDFAGLLPALAEQRQVIAVESQGHARTADIDRPLRYEQMADDVAGLLRRLGLDSGETDIFGFSMGAGTALQLALRHPELVHKLILAAGSFNSDGFHPGVLEGIGSITPEVFAGSPMEAAYLATAPNPGDWPVLVNKVVELDRQPQDWPAEAIAAIPAPTLLIFGDADVIRPEHAVELFRLRGGGVAGDIAGLPPAQLAILPGTTHIGLLQRTDLLLAIIPPFLDAPL